MWRNQRGQRVIMRSAKDARGRGVDEVKIGQRVGRQNLKVDPGRSFLIRPEAGVKMQDTIDMFQLTRDLGAYAVSFSPPDGEGSP